MGSVPLSELGETDIGSVRRRHCRHYSLQTPFGGIRPICFFKTNVDYVLCTKEGRPLLAIDFDGLGRGFDRYGTYVNVVETDDKYRKLKFDLKLKWG